MDRLSLLIFAAIVAIVSPAQAGILDKWHALISEASRRFSIPAGWIEAVIMAESNGDVRAVSPKGAMGLMQLMPDTWAELREQYGLGADPFDPRANILAGTAYLKAMHDRFGYPGLFAAYNAGPGRYEAHLGHGKPLPAETRAYVVRIEKTLASRMELGVGGAVKSPSTTRNPMQMVSRSRLFFPLSANGNGEDSEENFPAGGDLFVPLKHRKPHQR